MLSDEQQAELDRVNARQREKLGPLFAHWRFFGWIGREYSVWPVCRFIVAATLNRAPWQVQYCQHRRCEDGYCAMRDEEYLATAEMMPEAPDPLPSF